jgi:hypothetical protein
MHREAFKSWVEFCVGGKTFDPDIFTSRTGVSPTSSYRVGDEYQGHRGIQRRIIGRWCVNTASLASGNDMSMHFKALLNILSSSAAQVRDAIPEGCTFHLYIHHARHADEFGFTIDHDLLKLINVLGTEVSVTIEQLPGYLED